MNPDPADSYYMVVTNLEGQFSIWPETRDIPPGWSYVGIKGTKAECLAYIEAVWTDMRPLSLKKLMEEQKGED